MGQDRNIPMTNQSFVEAGGKELFGDLEMMTVIDATYDAGPGGWNDPSVESVNLALHKKALEVGADYLFKVEYGPDNVRPSSAIATPYKKL